MTELDHDRRGQARWLILSATMVGALYLCWLMLAPFINVLLWAGVLVLTFNGLHRWILARTRRPNLSAALATLFVVLVIGVVLGGVEGGQGGVGGGAEEGAFIGAGAEDGGLAAEGADDQHGCRGAGAAAEDHAKAAG